MELNTNEIIDLPVQYALMPIYRKAGRDLLGSYYELSAYVVSKCVVGEQIEKDINGVHETYYKVSFLVGVDINGLIDRHPQPEVIVNNLFADFETANEWANNVNSEISKRIFSGAKRNNYLMPLEMVKLERYSELKKAALIEEKIASYTADVPVSSYNNVQSKILCKRK